MFITEEREFTTAWSIIRRSLFLRITSELSRDTSVAFATEIPTSEKYIASASLIPSPKKPVIPEEDLIAETILLFWAGFISVKRLAFLTTSFRSLSSTILFKSVPLIKPVTSKSSFLQTQSAILSLSPVKIFTSILCFFKKAKAPLALSFGGSKNTI